MDKKPHKYSSVLVSYLAKDNFRILGMISVLKDILDEFILYKERFIETKALSILSDLSDSINSDIKRKIKLEKEILFKELDKQFSKICSTDQIKDDHIKIGALTSYIDIIFNKRSYKELIDHHAYSRVNNLYRVYKNYSYKSCEMLYYEMETFLTKEELKKIYHKITIS